MDPALTSSSSSWLNQPLSVAGSPSSDQTINSKIIDNTKTTKAKVDQASAEIFSKDSSNRAIERKLTVDQHTLGDGDLGTPFDCVIQ